MKSTIQPKRKRALVIASVLALAVITAVVLGTFDRTGDELSEADYFMASETPSEATLEAFRIGTEQMSSGDFQGAIQTYEEQLERLNEVPPGNMSAYFGDLGLAHYYQGQKLHLEGQQNDAADHFLRAAFMFEQAAETATHGVIVSVAEFYRALSLYSAKEYEGVRDAGELFLSLHPEVAISAEFLPEGAVATVKEILSVSYMSLSEQADFTRERENVLRANGLRYAEEAIEEAPEGVIQPYLYTGLEAYRKGQRDHAKERLQTYLSLMNLIPRDHWDEADYQSVGEVQSVLGLLD